MPEAKNVCLIDAPPVLARAFEILGCAVLELRASPAPFFSLPEALDGRDFHPDMVLQVECLGRRSLVEGLDLMDCPTLLWCLDPHLNAHWHGAWARLFDLTCSTQRRWIPRLRAQGAQDVRWLPWFGTRAAWRDAPDRDVDLAFVGRITPHRPARRWLADFLRVHADGFSLEFREGLNFRQMIEFYQRARIVPNESIAGEINFRLFEAASCGCLVLDQDLGEEQAALFEPGREIDTCAHAVELEDKLKRYLSDDRRVRAMGRAAWERVQAEHLPVHRAARLLEYAADAAVRRAQGEAAETWTALAAAGLWERGMLPLAAERVLKRLGRVKQTATTAAASLRVQSMAAPQRATATLGEILSRGLFAESPEFNLTGSMAALRGGRFDVARAFWFRHRLAANAPAPAPPEDETALLLLWAKDLHHRKTPLREGFGFDPERHLPASSVECLLALLARRPEDLTALRLLENILRPIPGMAQARLGFLSLLTLHERNDWRLGLETGLVDLKCFRLEPGLEELRLARDLARRTGREPGFARALADRDPSGLLAARLG